MLKSGVIRESNTPWAGRSEERRVGKEIGRADLKQT